MRSRWGFVYKGPGPTPLAALGRLYDSDIRRQEKAYIKWLAKARKWARKEAEEYARSHSPCGILSQQFDGESKLREAEHVGERCIIRTMKLSGSREHWGDQQGGKRWWKVPTHATPATYTVLIDGRYANAFLTKPQAKAWAREELERRKAAELAFQADRCRGARDHGRMTRYRHYRMLGHYRRVALVLAFADVTAPYCVAILWASAAAAIYLLMTV